MHLRHRRLGGGGQRWGRGLGGGLEAGRGRAVLRRRGAGRGSRRCRGKLRRTASPQALLRSPLLLAPPPSFQGMVARRLLPCTTPGRSSRLTPTPQVSSTSRAVAAQAGRGQGRKAAAGHHPLFRPHAAVR
ncbi:hypothetical protein PAHAL_9G297200 [Panicum hallii]|uniref:Uncharacterized protein n=1 Tax=Panicum hallii TaxID=206008 RepID=A0A2S3IMG6_9POAL|nr:hypothetical protein PAHAL_9G297200 [Panicum hallii]